MDNEKQRLHKALAEAQVAYQNKLDELNKFYDEIRAKGITDPLQQTGKHEKLMSELERLREERRLAEEAYEKYKHSG